MPRTLSNAQAEQLYTHRDAAIEDLASQAVITEADVKKFERTGRCKIANELWAKCDATAREALLTDEHHFVRSCAAISDRDHCA